MDCIKCGVDPCECRKPTSPVRDTTNQIPGDAITKEEFGFDLFEAIVCCGSILQLKQLREHTPPNKIKPTQLTDWQLKEKDLTARLMELTKTLPDADVEELLRRYPFMASI